MKSILYLALFQLIPLFALAQTDTTQSPLFRFTTSDLLELPLDVADVQVTTSAKNAERLHDALVSISVVSAYEIEGFGALSLRDVLDRVVGTYVTGSYIMPNNIISIRSDVTNTFNTHVLILLDGRPMRENLFNGFNSTIYSGISPSSIERIEIVRGPGSVLYGTAAFAGVVNIILKKGKKHTSQASQTVGTFNTLISEAGTGFEKNKLKMSLDFRMLNSKGWQFRAIDHEKLLIDERVGEQSVGAVLQLDYGTLQAKAFAGLTRNRNLAEQNFSKNEPYRETNNTRVFVDVGYQKKLMAWWNVSANLTYNRSHFYEDIALPTTEERGNYHDAFSTDALLEITNYLKPNANLNIIAGGLVNNLRGEYTQPHRTPDGKLYDYNLGAINHNPRISTPLYSFFWYSAYFQADYTIKERLKFLVGAQYNRTQETQSFVPRFGLLYKPTATWAGKIMYGEAFRSGSSFELYSTEEEAFGNPRLKNELIKTLEANLTYTKPTLSLSLTGYYSWVSDLIVVSDPQDSLLIYPNGASVPLYINAQSRQFYGVEFESKYLPSKHWQCSLSATVQDAVQYHQDAGEPEAVLRRQVTGIPRMMLKAGVLYRDSKKGWGIGVFHSYFGKSSELNLYKQNGHERDDAMFYNPTPTAFHNLSVQANIEIDRFFELDNTPTLIFSIFVQNALNQSIYYPDYNYSAVNSLPGRAGRGVYGKLQMRF